MLKRFAPLLTLASLLSYPIPYSSGQIVNPPPVASFTIDSITYTDANGKQQIVPFGNPQPVLPAVSVQSNLVVSGSYTPANAANIIASISVDNGTYTPALNNGKWTVTVPANTLPTNAVYNVWSQIQGNPTIENQAIVGQVAVNVQAYTFGVGIK